MPEPDDQPDAVHPSAVDPSAKQVSPDNLSPENLSPEQVSSVEVTLERPVAGGRVLGHDSDGRVLLASGAIAGERVRLSLVRSSERVRIGSVVEVVEPSPVRVDPPCRFVAMGCGGCDFQHISIDAQAEVRREVIADALGHIGHFSSVQIGRIPIEESVDRVPVGDRTTVRMAVDPRGAPGFRRESSHQILAVGPCLVAHPLLQASIARARFPGAHEVRFRASVHRGEVLAVVSGGRSDPAGWSVPDGVRTVALDQDRPRGERARAGRGASQHGGSGRGGAARGVANQDGGADPRGADPDGDGGRGTAARPGAGAHGDPDERPGPWIIEEVSGVELRISARSFFQSGPLAAGALVATVARALGDRDLGRDRLVDLYGGVGLFTAGLRAANAQVVERSSSAVADARVNTAHLGTKVIRSAVESWRPSKADVVVADPSRKGLGRRGVDTVAAIGAGRVVLVSCDPAAMARDLSDLVAAGYGISRIELVDMFPHTHHIEAVTVLEGPPGGRIN